MKRIGLCLFFACLVFGVPRYTHADATADIQSQIDANNQVINSLQATIASYQKQLDALGTEKSTLQSTISALTLSQKQLATQIQVTQSKITSANLQIQQLTSSIGDKETNIAADQDAISDAFEALTKANKRRSLLDSFHRIR